MANLSERQVYFLKPDLFLRAGSAGAKIKLIVKILLTERLRKVLKAPAI